MPVSRLNQICRQVVELDPDLVLLTGDFFTVEAHGPPKNSLRIALEPLQKIAHKTFACLGNHDKEKHALPLIEKDLKELGIRLLVDEEALIEAAGSPIQLIGMNFYGIIPSCCKKFPKRENHLRLIMLHDPTGFQFIPEDDKSIVFSGHTHGGQLGLLSLGLPYTVVSLAGIPDHGFWGKGENRLYVNRGQGCRSVLGTMIVRLAVPPEHSLINIHH